MTSPSAVIDEVRERRHTELSRLGSSKALYAATGGEIETDSVLHAAADAEFSAFETFSTWAEDSGKDEIRRLFEGVAETERDHYETVIDRLDDEHEPPKHPPVPHPILRSYDDPIDRLGGFIGRTIASDRSKQQVIGYFVGDADPQTASLFRSLVSDLDGQLEEADSVLESIVRSEEERQRATDAADDVITAIYDEYVTSLEDLGVNPKPVC